MSWKRSETKRYGGEDYMTKKQRLDREEQYDKNNKPNLLWRLVKILAPIVILIASTILAIVWCGIL